jgi:hypothetical protein
MKRVALLFVALLALVWMSGAQDQSSAGQTATTTTTKKTHKKAAASDAGASDASSAKASGKTSTVTGCISSDKGPDGDYTLTNGRYKNGVDVSGSDDLSKHAGHKVQLTGTWTTPGKAFQETKIKHISETCTAAPSKGATAGKDTTTTSTKKTKKSKSADDTATPKG